jgi:hypothetical protein
MLSKGEGYRIIFVHVPASWMSMVIYLAMGFWSVMGLTFKTRLSGMMTQALAPTGAIFAALSLWTGALWGKPMWGTWWVWDARLTSELILFFLYVGFIALTSAIDDVERAERAGALISIVGCINVPIIYFFSQMVEHLASRRECVYHAVALNGKVDVMGHVVDGDCILALYGSDCSISCEDIDIAKRERQSLAARVV